MDEQLNTAEAEAPALDAAQRKALKALAHPLKPVVMIGDAGLTPSVLAEIERALNSHELIKIRVLGDDREARIALLEAICAQTASAPVQHIGKLLVIWRQSAEQDDSAAPKRRRKPNAPYQPKKAAGAGQKAPVRRAPRERTPAPMSTDQGSQGRASLSRARDTTGTSGARASALGRGAALGKPGGPGTGARDAAKGAGRGAEGSEGAARRRPGAPINTARAARPGRAPVLASPGAARTRISGGRKR